MIKKFIFYFYILGSILFIVKYSTISLGISTKDFCTVLWKFFELFLKEMNFRHFLCGTIPSSLFKFKKLFSTFSNFVYGPLPRPITTTLMGKDELIIKLLENSFSSIISLFVNNKRTLYSLTSYFSISIFILVLNFLIIKF